TLFFATDARHEAAGLALAPFGWHRLLVVQLLATLPLSLLLAYLLARSRLKQEAPLGAVLWTAVGVSLAWATYAAGSAAGVILTPADAGFFSRLVLRVAWCLLLELPWCLAGRWLAGPVTGEWRTIPPRFAALLAVVGAVVLPGVYAHTLIAEQTREAESLL